MRYKQGIVFTLFLSSIFLFGKAQNLVIQGKITDLVTDRILPFASITFDHNLHYTSDTSGFYRIKTETGRHHIIVRVVGYRNYETIIDEDMEGIKLIDIMMEPFINQLEQVVVAASRKETRVAKEVMSINVIKPYLIANTNAADLSDVVNRIPGVNVVDGQATIRGGTGFSYNTGSRVAVLLDDMPLLGADLGDVQWKFLPIEAAEQIEVIKGSASVLYGSSALNGTINVRTGWPGRKPQTKFQLSQGISQNYERSYINWWEPSTQPFSTSFFFSHKQAFGNFDLVASGSTYFNRSQLQYGDDFRGRLYIKTRYRDKKVPGLTYGLNGNLMFDQAGRFILWK